MNETVEEARGPPGQTLSKKTSWTRPEVCFHNLLGDSQASQTTELTITAWAQCDQWGPHKEEMRVTSEAYG